MICTGDSYNLSIIDISFNIVTSEIKGAGIYLASGTVKLFEFALINSTFNEISSVFGSIIYSEEFHSNSPVQFKFTNMSFDNSTSLIKGYDSISKVNNIYAI